MAKSGAECLDVHRPSEILDTLKRLGFRAVVAVPDGWLGEFLVHIEQEPTLQLVRATHEEEALAIACGIRLGGVRTALLVQNAGVLSMGAGMVSLAQRYQFPLLMLVSYRGTPEDAIFYHIPKGRVTESVFTGLALAHARTGRSGRRSNKPRPMLKKPRARSRCCFPEKTFNGERHSPEQG
jgi:sulfopyruvate decarboxylase subunit alpha